jgi:hypothetical protein
MNIEILHLINNSDDNILPPIIENQNKLLNTINGQIIKLPSIKYIKNQILLITNTQPFENNKVIKIILKQKKKLIQKNKNRYTIKCNNPFHKSLSSLTVDTCKKCVKDTILRNFIGPLPKIYTNREIYIGSKAGNLCSYCIIALYKEIYNIYLLLTEANNKLLEEKINKITCISTIKSCAIHKQLNKNFYCPCSNETKKIKWANCHECKKTNKYARAGKIYCDICLHSRNNCKCKCLK